jgi:hypothetical protein
MPQRFTPMFISGEDEVSPNLPKTVIKLPKLGEDWEMPDQLQQFFQINPSGEKDPPSEPVLEKVNTFVLRLFGQAKQEYDNIPKYNLDPQVLT